MSTASNCALSSSGLISILFPFISFQSLCSLRDFSGTKPSLTVERLPKKIPSILGENRSRAGINKAQSLKNNRVYHDFWLKFTRENLFCKCIVAKGTLQIQFSEQMTSASLFLLPNMYMFWPTKHTSGELEGTGSKMRMAGFAVDKQGVAIT